MTLWRRVTPTIVRVSLLSASVGTFTTLIATGTYALYMFVTHVPAFLDPMESLGTRCAAEPAGFTMNLSNGDQVRTFDYAQVPSGDAGPDPKLLAQLRGGSGAAMRLLWLEEYGGAMLFRRGESGPCSLMEFRYRVSPLARIGTLVLALALAGFSALMAGLLVATSVVRPIIRRVQSLSRAAARVGEAKDFQSASDPFPDELGTLSRQLDFAHERIRAVTQELLDRNRSLETNLADVAHDLKTPLSSVQLALEGLARSGGPAQETARACLDDCVYLAAMIDNLRVGTQLADGVNPGADGARAEMGELVEQVVRRLRPLGRFRGVEVDRALAGGEVWVGCRPLALERVIDNLVSNAVRHGRSGGHVAVLLELESGRFRLRVLDDGPGVPAEEFPMLGRRRFRGAVAKVASHGTGLGLAIVAEVCQRCGWELKFEPNDPTGLQVIVSGPVVEPPSKDTAAGAA